LDEDLTLIPLSDENPTVLRPLVTIAIIMANVAVFLYQLSLLVTDPRLEEALIYQLGIVPAAMTHGMLPNAGQSYRIITSMFLHGGWLHIIGNMLYLWIFGNNVEDSMGHFRFAVFYLLTGIIAACAHIAFQPASTVPTIGASGAVSGILGAYLVLHPHARIKTLVPLFIFFTVVYLPAWLFLVVWIGWQVLSQTLFSVAPDGGGIAYGAHIGGFIAGAVLIPFFRKYRRGSSYSH
jgi:membrane associated rhomboid family serine protease